MPQLRIDDPIDALPHWTCPRDRAATRNTLLAAARLLIARHGAVDVTLSAVADEAGLARATVYGYFSGKSELLAALVAEDRRPELSPQPIVPAEPVALEMVAKPAAPAIQGTVPIWNPPIAASADFPTPGAGNPDEPRKKSRDALALAIAQEDAGRQQQAAQLEEIARRLILPECTSKDGTDAVIARLEMRMRVLETSLTTLTTRHAERDVEEERKLKPLSDLIAGLQNQVEASKAQQLHMASALRLELHELTTELELTRQGKALPPRPAWPKLAPDYRSEREIAPAAIAVEETQEHRADTPEDVVDQSYLAAARNAAQEGARRLAEQDQTIEGEKRARKRRIMIAGCVVVGCLVLVGAFFQLHAGTQRTEFASARRPVPHALVPSAREASSAPLARLTSLAHGGDSKAELILGLKILEGNGGPANDREAARWIGIAARQGYPVAQNSLGSLYQHGRGVALDAAEAMHWYEAAAKQGDRHAMSNLGVLFASGRRPNFAEAARWFLRAAELGHVDAQFNLAVLYERGDGVPQSLMEAYKWYAIAGSSGDRAAKTRAEAIATQISPAELQAAEDASLGFKPLPLNGAANDLPAAAMHLAQR